jgi:pyrroline-5-carboxylate reductase
MTRSNTSPLLTHPLAFIGGGNMARSLIGGLIARGASAASIRVAEPVEVLREALARDFGVSVFATALEAAEGASLWVLAVKPQVMRTVCEGMAAVAQSSRPLVVSIAAGITARQMQRWLGGDAAIIRAMPNTPALLGAGVTGLFATAQVDAAGRQRTEELLASAGTTVWIEDEAKMDAVTAVSGSGPAYVFLLVEAMAAAGAKLGLTPDMAMQLARATVAGSGELLKQSSEPASQLRVNVTSPGGTTAEALKVLMAADGIQPVFDKALAAASRRSKELAG